MSQNNNGKKQVGQNMLKLLTEKEQKTVAGGQRGPVTPSGPNGCTYIPRQGGRPC